MLRDAKAAQSQRGAGGRNRQYDMSQQTRRVLTVYRDGRNRSDRGMVVVLDRRIIAKSYGRAFLESIPYRIA